MLSEDKYAVIVLIGAHLTASVWALTYPVLHPIAGLATQGAQIFLFFAANFSLKLPGVNALITIIIPQYTYPIYLYFVCKTLLKGSELNIAHVDAIRKATGVTLGDVIETMKQYDDTGLNRKDLKPLEFKAMVKAVAEHNEERKKRVIKKSIVEGLPKLREELRLEGKGKSLSDFSEKYLARMEAGEIVSAWVALKDNKLAEQERNVRFEKNAVLNVEDGDFQLDATIDDTAVSNILGISVDELNRMSSDDMLSQWKKQSWGYSAAEKWGPKMRQ